MPRILSSYSKKSIFLLLLVGLVPVIIISSILYVEKIESETNILYDRIKSISKLGAQSVDQWLTEKIISLQSISNDKLLINNVKKIQQYDELSVDFFSSKFVIEERTRTAMYNFDWLDELIIYDTSGNVLFYTGLRYPIVDHSEFEYFRNSINGELGIGSIYPSSEPLKHTSGIYSTGIPTLFLSIPIKGEVGIEGILVARISVNEMIIPLQNEFDLENYIVNSDGMVIHASKSHPIFSTMFDLIETQSNSIISNEDNAETLFNLAKSFGSSNTEYGYPDASGNLIISSIQAIPDSDWFYISEIPKEHAFEKINSLQVILLSSIILIIIGIVWVSIFFSNSLSSPIKQLQLIAERISNGERNIPPIIFGDKEIVDLSRSLKTMVDSLIHSENKIKTAEQKYRKLYEDAPEMYRTVNNDGILIDCNKTYCEKLGYEKHELIGKSLFDFVPDSHKDTMHDIFSIWKNHGMVRNREVMLRKKDGTVFPVLLSASSVTNENGEVTAANTLIRDMSDLYNAQKEIEELRLKRLSVVGELTARIAHDLRNPLSVIKNSVEILRLTYEDKMDDAQRQQWERLERGIYRITHQVDDVLDYIRAPPLKIEENSLSVIIQDTIERIQIPDTVNIHPPKNNVIIPCDAEKLEVVFVNLIMNAIQAFEGKAGDVTISINEHYDSDNSVLIQIIDNGPGIPNDLIEKIFEPLFTTRQIGTGLGLPSCKNIIERHNGTLTVSSDKNSGTTFSIVLPIHNEKFLTTKL